MARSATRVRTDQIGDELARIIRDGAGATLRLKVVRFGGIEQMSLAPDWDRILPAIFIDPQEATYPDEGGLDVGGIQYVVTESYRIVYFMPYLATDDAARLAAENVRQIVKPLADDASLSGMGLVIAQENPRTADQISWSGPNGIEWTPEEQVFLTDAAQRVKVVAIRWNVRWYNRI